LQSTISFLNKITSSEGRGSLEQFKKTFTERYEDREIPLLLALDTEIGIGYPINSKPNDSTPLLENFFTPQRISYNSLVNMTKLQSVLLTKYTELKTNGQSEIILTDEDFVGLKENWDNLPLTFYALFEIVKTEKNNILLKINTISGNSGANLISRYAYCNEDIYNLTTEITAKEDELANGSIIAEIAYLPDSRIGNIISRPNIRKYEIVYLSNTDIDQEYQIPLSDLMISVKKDKIYIRSKKLNKLIIPRLTTAHNYENNPIPAYSFLCDMQYYTTDRSRLYFDWGFLTQVINYRPRVKYKNSILSLASWTISINNIKLLFLTKNNAELINGFKDWREKINMPRYVMLLDGDNKLFVDWNSKMSILALFSSIKQKQSVIFEEFLFDSQNALVKCNDETYTNECIVIFYKDIAK
jgi:hypothetical protein